VACGVESIEANGELGRMSFSFISDHYQDEKTLTEASFVTGQEHSFHVDLTHQGEREANENASQISYQVLGSNASVSTGIGIDDEDGEDLPPDFTLQVDSEGTVAVEAMLDGVLFDRITLQFADPTELELVLFSRGPWEESFQALPTQESLTVQEGTQLAWLSIPSKEGQRLLGDIETDMSADPMEKVVPAANVEHVNEDEAMSVFRADSLYFIEEGSVSIQLLDPVSAVTGIQNFEVIP